MGNVEESRIADRIIVRVRLRLIGSYQSNEGETSISIL